ncbi:MAG TPA: PLDc N-terminal domain-containing protein [Nevskiaceae bacterium]|nr:PLDc N-terminal domain-containing protein [Nevskiaceae bacterium]
MKLNLSFWGLIVLIADLYAIIHIVQSRAEPLKKALWIVGVLVFPVLGFIVWWFAGPRSGRS